MKNFYQLVAMLGLAFFFASCASKTTVTQKKVRSGLDSYNDGYELTKDEQGMSRSVSKQVSQFDGQRQSNIGGRDFAGKDYNKESYRKERWGGNKGYTANQYGGNTDGSKFQHAPHYVSRKAYDGGGFKSIKKNQFNAGKYNTGRAQEGRLDTVKTGSSDFVSSRHDAPDPLVISREDYNKLSVRETKSMLGR